jgi:hypothetical protein
MYAVNTYVPILLPYQAFPKLQEFGDRLPWKMKLATPLEIVKSLPIKVVSVVGFITMRL